MSDDSTPSPAMPAEGGIVLRADSDAPVVTLNRLRSIDTHEVMDIELETLDQIVSTENRSFGFMTFWLGTGVTSLLTIATMAPRFTWSLVVVVALAIVSAGEAVRSVLSWRKAKVRRPKLIEAIRSRSRRLN